MAKNRKKKSNDAVAMEIAEHTGLDHPNAMETSDTEVQNPNSSALLRKMKKGRPMKRSKNVRKMKAMAKAITKSEKSVEKIKKKESKTTRVQSAKLLYD